MSRFSQAHNDYLDPDRHLWPDEEPKIQTIYKVVWDNGDGHASGEFSETFTTEQAAQDFGNNWLADMRVADQRGANQYSFEVIEGEAAQ